jgi:hypothetical protein
MVGMIPVGDIVSLAKVARQLAQYGWKDQLNACKVYHASMAIPIMSSPSVIRRLI